MGRGISFANAKEIGFIACDIKAFGNKKNGHIRMWPGICMWEERGNKIIVEGGCTYSYEYVEEYDMNQDKWIILPKSNKKHDFSPTLMVTNNIFFCIGGGMNGDELGYIELLDQEIHQIS